MLAKKSLFFAVVLLVFVVFLFGMTKLSMREIPDDLNAVINVIKKPQIIDKDGKPLNITYQNKFNLHNIISLHEIPEFLQQVFILSEDKRFYEHGGIDWIARINAIYQNLITLKIKRGASTISEQVIKMLHTRKRSFWTRWVEGWEAYELELKFDKATILEFYLNQVPYTAQRRGLKQATIYYFKRNLNTLNQKEMLSLAVLIKAPSRQDLYKNTAKTDRDINILLDRLKKNNIISDKQIQEIKTQTIDLVEKNNSTRTEHFINYIIKQNKIKNNNKIIKTTIDGNLQKIAQNLLLRFTS
ncbi:MAG: hypothetical protein DRQ51_00455 [Gammaproteobacteria bacterium]|nr:MAG: hypothetical protein DRQ51_00455 [Gammaproteobacteria bacterium]